jgi:hypothetical protein
MTGMYQDGECTAISCHKPATLELVLEVPIGCSERYPQGTFLDRLGYCDYDFGFFYRKLLENYSVVNILVVPGVDSPVQVW